MTEVAKAYGGALYDLCAEEGVSEQVLAQLEAVRGLFADDPAYIRLLTTPVLGEDERLGLVDQAFAGKAHPYIVNFIKLLTARKSAGEMAGCVEEYRRRYHSDHGIEEITAVTAQPLDQELERKLTERLSQVTGKTVLLKSVVEPGVLGGVRLELPGVRLDGTLKRKLESIRSDLLSIIA